MVARPTIVLLHGGPGADHSLFKPEFSAMADAAQVVYLQGLPDGLVLDSTPFGPGSLPDGPSRGMLFISRRQHRPLRHHVSDIVPPPCEKVTPLYVFTVPISSPNARCYASFGGLSSCIYRPVVRLERLTNLRVRSLRVII